MLKRIARFAAPLLVLAAGIAVLVILKNTKPEANKRETSDPGALVEVIEVTPQTQTVVVQVHGNVIPAREVALGPEVSGKVVWVHDRLSPGSRFEKGERLIRIDPREYQLAVEQKLATVDRALTELQVEKGRKKIAEREWEMFEGKEGEETGGEKGSSLALREPQLRTAKVALESARSGLQQAKLAVSKTRVEAPFNALVKSESVELGQMVGPSTPLLTLVGTDAYWVQVSVPVDRLGWIAVPGVGRAAEGASARIIQEVARGQRVERAGRVIRLLGDVDPAGRMARLLVEIDDPLGLKTQAGLAGDPAESPLPLLLGSFVQVEIEGREVDDVIAIPREALREGRQVYVMTEEDKLEKRRVNVIWRRPDTVLVRDGLEAGDRVVTSPVPTPVDGMKLRVRKPGDAAQSDEKAARADP